MKYVFDEKEVVASNRNYWIYGACILFQNQGDHPVWVGLIKLLPGDSYKIDIMPPNYVDQNISIRFEDTPVSVTGSLRVVSGKKLIVSSLVLSK